MSVLKTTNLKKHYGANAVSATRCTDKQHRQDGQALVKAIDGVDFAVESGGMSGVRCDECG